MARDGRAARLRMSAPSPVGGNMADEPSASSARERTTIRDVARAAGVHPSLVSRVVNNHPKAYASTETRERILKAVEELGYRPHPLARGLRIARTLTLGLLLPDLANPMYASIVAGVDSRAGELGYGVVFGTHAEGGVPSTFTRLLEDGRVDGLLVASAVLKDSFMRDVAQSGVGPVVLVNRRVRGIASSVVVDDDAGAALAVEHLVGLGHRSITGVFGPANIDTARRRMAGFARACAASGISPSLVEWDSWTAHAGYEAGLSVLDDLGSTTAIFASSLVMGMGILRAARERGIAVPEELSVIALHDSDVAAYLQPQLTTVAMPTEQMGREAASLVIGQIDGLPAKHIMVKDAPQLILRASTAAPAS